MKPAVEKVSAIHPVHGQLSAEFHVPPAALPSTNLPAESTITSCSSAIRPHIESLCLTCVRERE